jgi:hypothetical protein
MNDRRAHEIVKVTLSFSAFSTILAMPYSEVIWSQFLARCLQISDYCIP